MESINIANVAKAYKALSESLGYKSISTTLDSHITDDSYDELNLEFEEFLNRTFLIE